MKKRFGFTLIEIILTLMLVGVAAVVILPFFQSGLFTVSESMEIMDESLKLNQVMADMVADFNTAPYPPTDATGLAAFQARVANTGTGYGPSGYSYSVTTATGKLRAADADNSLFVTITSNDPDYSGLSLTTAFSIQ